MPIRVGTSDNGVHVHGIADSMCATALPYVDGCLAVAPRPPERRCRSGACGRGRERPPSRHALIGSGEGGHVHAPATLPGGVAPVQGSLREGCSTPLLGGGSPVRRPSSRCVSATATDRGAALPVAPTVGSAASATGNGEQGVGAPDPRGVGKSRSLSPRLDLFPGPEPVQIVRPSLHHAAAFGQTPSGCRPVRWDP